MEYIQLEKGTEKGNGKHIRGKKLTQWKLESMMVVLKKWSGKKEKDKKLWISK